jgi:hypothetical protein
MVQNLQDLFFMGLKVQLKSSNISVRNLFKACMVLLASLLSSFANAQSTIETDLNGLNPTIQVVGSTAQGGITSRLVNTSSSSQKVFEYKVFYVYDSTNDFDNYSPTFKLYYSRTSIDNSVDLEDGSWHLASTNTVNTATALNYVFTDYNLNIDTPIIINAGNQIRLCLVQSNGGLGDYLMATANSAGGTDSLVDTDMTLVSKGGGAGIFIHAPSSNLFNRRHYGGFTFESCSSGPTTVYDTICPTDSLVFNGQVLTASGTYVDTFTNTTGCDSVVTLNLHKLPQISMSYTVSPASVCPGNNYCSLIASINTPGVNVANRTWSPTTYIGNVNNSSYALATDVLASITYTHTVTDARGCTYTVAVPITVKPTYQIYDTLTACDTVFHLGYAHTKDSIIVDQYYTVGGCDSTRYTVILPRPTLQIAVTIDSVAQNCGGTYTRFGLAYTNINASMNNENLVWYKPMPDTIIFRNGGFSAPVRDNPITISNNMVYNTTNALGCNAFTAGSLVGKIAVMDRGTCQFVDKVQNAQNAGAIAAIIIDNIYGGIPVIMGGTSSTITIPAISILKEDGDTLKARLQNNIAVTGKATHQDLTIGAPGANYYYSLSDTSLDFNITGSNLPITFTVKSFNGCQAPPIVLTGPSVKFPSDSIFTYTACDSFYWAAKNKWYYASNTTDTAKLVNAVGCDSVLKLNLTINKKNDTVIVLNACDSITIQGTTYYNDTIVYSSFTNINSCDSNVQYTITHNNSTVWYLDADGDGFGTPLDSIRACIPPQNYVADFSDCDDSNSNAYPREFYIDADGDGRGSITLAQVCFSTCNSAPAGYALKPNDCDDNDASDSCMLLTSTAVCSFNNAADTITTCGLTLYDNGYTGQIQGISYAYGAGSSAIVQWGTYVFKPATPGSYIQITFDTLNAGNSQITIWNGSNISATPLLQGNPGALGNVTFTSSAPDGSLTFDGKTFWMGGGSAEGIKAKISCVTDTCTYSKYYPDNDSDGLGNPNRSIVSCTPPVELNFGFPWVPNNTDCADYDPSRPYFLAINAASACDSVTYMGITYDTTTNIVDSLVAQDGCDSIVTTVITVLAKPTLQLATDSVVACNAKKLTLTATSNGLITWLNAGVVNGVPFTLDQTTTYTVSSVDTVTNCTNQKTVYAELGDSLMEISVQSFNQQICPNGNGVILGSGKLSGGTYQWYRNDTLLANETFASISAFIPGKYVITSPYKTCIDSNAMMVVLADSVVPNLTITPNRICKDQPITILENTAAVCDTTRGFVGNFIDVNYATQSDNGANFIFKNTDTLIITTLDSVYLPSNYNSVAWANTNSTPYFVSFDWSYTTTDNAFNDAFTISYNGSQLVPFTFNQSAGTANQSGHAEYIIGDPSLANGTNGSISFNSTTNGTLGEGILKVFNLKSSTCKNPYELTIYDDDQYNNVITSVINGEGRFTPTISGTQTYYAEVLNLRNNCYNNSLIPVTINIGNTPTIDSFSFYNTATSGPNSGNASMICAYDTIAAVVHYTNGSYAIWHPTSTIIGDTATLPAISESVVIVVDSTSGCFVQAYPEYYSSNIVFPQGYSYIEPDYYSICPGEPVTLLYGGVLPTSLVGNYSIGTPFTLNESTQIFGTAVDPTTGCSIPVETIVQVYEYVKIDSVVADTSICDGTSTSIKAYSSSNILSYAEQNIAYTKEVPTGNVTYLCKDGLTLGAVPAYQNGGQYFSAISLPFDFQFYAKKYNKAYADLNAYLSFDPSSLDGSKYNASNIPSSNSAAAAIIVGGTSVEKDEATNLFYFTNGTAPNRKFVMQWDGKLESSNERVKAQIILHEGTNAITMNLEHLNNTGTNFDAAIGIQNSDYSYGQCVNNYCGSGIVAVDSESYLLTPIYDSSVFTIQGNDITSVINPLNVIVTPDLGTTTYSISVSQGSGFCPIQTTIDIKVNANPTVTANASATSTCSNNTVLLTGGGASTYVWSGGAVDSVAIPINTTTTFTVTGTDANSCTKTSSVIVTVSAATNEMALAFTGNSSSMSGADSSTQQQSDGTTVDYTDANCDLIATVDDGTGGNVLGTTIALVTVEATTPTHNNQPYVNRWYKITPTNQGGADVTLYFTQDDFNDYNTYALGYNWPLLPQNGDNADPNISNIRITKVSNGDLGDSASTMSVITPTSFWNAANNYWELSFSVTSFSGFYVHSVNVNNSPLNVNFVYAKGAIKGNCDVLSWQVSKPENVVSYDVIKLNQSGNTMLDNTVNTNYENCLVNQNAMNAYRIQANLASGTSIFSNVIELSRTGNASVSIYPNPAQTTTTVEVNLLKSSVVTIKITDVTGKLIRTIETLGTKGSNTFDVELTELAAGLYTVQINADNVNLGTQQLLKQ